MGAANRLRCVLTELAGMLLLVGIVSGAVPATAAGPVKIGMSLTGSLAPNGSECRNIGKR